MFKNKVFIFLICFFLDLIYGLIIPAPSKWQSIARKLEESQPKLVSFQPGGWDQPIEAMRVYSKTLLPEGWEGKAETHIPKMILKGKRVQVSITHEMNPTKPHFIDTIYVYGKKDGNPEVVYLAQLDEYDDNPVVEFDLPRNVQWLMPFAHCNEHGLWNGDKLDLGHKREEL
eukprot:c3774_g1_i1.p1 GENE.c3774_g1_i1~~c3774_g1_i1.p1  ORF type:complete len:172 (+),score=78.08 c3774_g1_i1:36-551(+)